MDEIKGGQGREPDELAESAKDWMWCVLLAAFIFFCTCGCAVNLPKWGGM